VRWHLRVCELHILYPHRNCTRPLPIEDGSGPHAVLSNPLDNFVIEQIRLWPGHASELRNASSAGPDDGPSFGLQRRRLWVYHLQYNSLLEGRVIRPHLEHAKELPIRLEALQCPARVVLHFSRDGEIFVAPLNERQSSRFASCRLE
jgi:hypothetical protein